MLFDFGWSEIMLIAVVALVVIGPKDLPKAMRVAGYWMRKARALSQEFRDSVDEVMREAELHEMREQLKKTTEFDFDRAFQNTINPDGSLVEHAKPPELPDFSQPAPAVTEAAAAPESESGIEPKIHPEIHGDPPGAAVHVQPPAVAVASGLDPAAPKA